MKRKNIIILIIVLLVVILTTIYIVNNNKESSIDFSILKNKPSQRVLNESNIYAQTKVIADVDIQNVEDLKEPLEIASSVVKVRANKVKETSIYNSFYPYQIIECEIIETVAGDDKIKEKLDIAVLTDYISIFDYRKSEKNHAIKMGVDKLSDDEAKKLYIQFLYDKEVPVIDVQLNSEYLAIINDSSSSKVKDQIYLYDTFRLVSNNQIFNYKENKFEDYKKIKTDLKNLFNQKTAKK